MSNSDNFKEFHPNILKDLPEEERKEKLKQFLEYAKSRGDCKVVLYDATNNRNIDMFELVNKLGDEKAIELLNKIFAACQNIEGVDATPELIQSAIERVRHGHGTEEDMKVLRMITAQSSEADDAKRFLNAYLDIMTSFMYTIKNKLHYDANVVDLLGGVCLFLYTNFVASEEYDGSRLGLYKDNMDAAIGVISAVSDSIDKTFKASLTEELSPELYVAGLLDLACNVAAKNNLPFGDIKNIAKVLDIEEGIKEMEVVDTSYAQAMHDAEKIAPNTDVKFAEELVKQVDEVLHGNGSNKEPQPGDEVMVEYPPGGKIVSSKVTEVSRHEQKPKIVQPNIVTPQQENQDKKDRLKNL